MLSLLMSLALLAVIVTSLALGVGLGYATIFGILHLFDRSRRTVKATPAPAMHTSPSGD